MNTSREIRSAFLLAITLTVGCASSVLAQAEGTFFPVGLTPLFAVAAWQFNERKQWIVLPVILANIFGVLAILAAGWELMFGTVEARILSGAHLIVYLTWVVLFMRKQDRQYWWLLALSVLQLAIAGVLTRAPSLGFALILMLFLLVWTMSLFSLNRLKVRAAQPDSHLPSTTPAANNQSVIVQHGIQTDAGTSWIGLRFRMMILGMCLASLVMSGIAFAAFPRVFVGTPFLSQNLDSQSPGLIQRTGFRERVKLGEFGSILQSNERVLRIAAFEQTTGRPMSIEEFVERMEMDELLLRGSVMGRYAAGEWDQGTTANGFSWEENRRRFSRSTAPDDCVRVEITQDAPIGTFAFVPTPIIAGRLVNSKGRLLQRAMSESVVFDIVEARRWEDIQTPDFNEEPILFEVYCPRPEVYRRRTPPIPLPDPLQNWVYPNAESQTAMRREETDARGRSITPDLPVMLPKLCALARQLCFDGDSRVAAEECARRVVRLLRDSKDYEYSLTVVPSDTSLDPVEDFLINHRTGHCQYFASAGALMLQSVGIPARIVNGFKGTEQNLVSQQTEVRQKHAHVWVEYRDQKRWFTIDPTPAARNDFLQVPDDQGVLGDFQEAVTDIWDAGVNNVTPEQQRAAIAPFLAGLRDSIASVRQLGVLGAMKVFLDEVVANPSRWFNWRVLAGTLILLLPLILLFRHHSWQWARSMVRWLRRLWNPRQRTATHIVRFYDNFCKACRQAGLTFPDTQTARENAAAALKHFHEQLTPDVEPIPLRLADAFNAIRYGDHLLTAEQTERLGRDVVLLTTAISTATGRRR